MTMPPVPSSAARFYALRLLPGQEVFHNYTRSSNSTNCAPREWPGVPAA